MSTFWQKIFRFGKPIEVFVRHCNFSSLSYNNKRLKGFSKELCHKNLLATLDKSLVNVTFLLDTKKGSLHEHFLSKEKLPYPIVEVKEGTETGSFLRLLELVEQKKLHPETIVYFLEDDYLHRPGWVDILLEGFSIPGVDYVTLYDHKDKYFFPMYDNLSSRIFCTKSSHWRTTPSTTNTYAMRWKTLQAHMETHKSFSLNREVSADHEKFLELGRQGSTLVSSIPGFSTHCEIQFASPCVNWEKLFLEAAQK